MNTKPKRHGQRRCRKKRGCNIYLLRHNSGSAHPKRHPGKKNSKNIRYLKEEFLLDLYRRQRCPDLKTILDNYQKERAVLPQSVRLQNLESFGITFTYDTRDWAGGRGILTWKVAIRGQPTTPSKVGCEKLSQGKQKISPRVRASQTVSQGRHPGTVLWTACLVHTKTWVQRMCLWGKRWCGPPLHYECNLQASCAVMCRCTVCTWSGWTDLLAVLCAWMLMQKKILTVWHQTMSGMFFLAKAFSCPSVCLQK